MGISASVKLDNRCAQPNRGRNLLLAGLDEQGHADVRRAKLVDKIGELVVLPSSIQSALGGSLLALLRDDAGRMGFVGKSNRQHLLGCRHLEVQWQVDLGHQPVDILVSDVPAVLAKMSRDAIGAGARSLMRGPDRVGVRPAARVPDRRDMIDVDAETQALAHAATRLPGLTAGILASSSGR